MGKVIIFYSNTGSGHLRAAQALKDELLAFNQNTQVILIDGLERTSFGLKINTSSAYITLSHQFLWLFNLIYFLTNNLKGANLLRFLIRLFWGNSLKKKIETEDPDLIISTHHHISPSTIMKNLKDTPFITIVTDLSFPHLLWFDPKSTKTITPTEQMAEFAKNIVSLKPTQIQHISYPSKSPTNLAKNNLTDTLLILGGGSGAGNLLKQVKILLKELPGKKILVVCGNNKNLQSQLEGINNSNLKVFGYVEDMASLYKLADIIITKAGPGTIIEATAFRKPLILTSWVGLQEKDNIDFVLDNNLGIFEPEVQKLPTAIDKVYQNYTSYISKKPIFSGGAKEIASKIIAEGYLS